jgi:hypothetical protein
MADLKEKLQIFSHKSTHRKFGYNRTYGGQGQCGTVETRRKISAILRGVKRGPFSEERKRKHSEALRGRVMTEETRRKISEARRGIRLSTETRQKLSELRRGVKKTPFSAEHRSNLSKTARSEERNRRSAASRRIRSSIVMYFGGTAPDFKFTYRHKEVEK